jgi:hypothetical protein
MLARGEGYWPPACKDTSNKGWCLYWFRVKRGDTPGEVTKEETDRDDGEDVAEERAKRGRARY